jgi:branched-chain amino acid transport system substrate-binding protein
MIKSKYIAFLLTILFLINDAHAVETASTKPIVKIGAIFPLTGNMAHVGNAYRDAVRMALEEVPANSKFHYEAIFEDDQFQLKNTAIAVNKLVSVDKVDVLISMWSNGGNIVNPIAERHQILHFGLAWDPRVARGTVSFDHCTPPSVFLKMDFAAFEKKGWKKFALISFQDSGSIFCLDEFERMAKRAGMEVVYRESVNLSERDFRTIIAKAEARQPDAFFVNLKSPEIELFVRQLKEINPKRPITAAGSFDVVQDLKLIEGKWYASGEWTPADFSEKFYAKYGLQQLEGCGNYYDIAKLIIYSYEHLPSAVKPPAAELAKLIQTQYIKQFPSIFGKIEMGSDNILGYSPQLLMIKNGKRVPITLNELP